jgi:hypothetical protein
MTYTEAFLNERDELTARHGGARVATRVAVGGAAAHVTDWYPDVEAAREGLRSKMYYDVSSGRDRDQNRTYYLLTGQPAEREVYSHASHGVDSHGEIFAYAERLPKLAPNH